MIQRCAAVVALLVGLGACASDGTPEDPGMEVVATTSVLADVVADLVGESGSVQALMEPGDDPHEFSPSAEETALLRSADLVVANGYGLEANLTDSLQAAEEDGTAVVELAAEVHPLEFGLSADEHQDDVDHGEDEGHDHGEYDPHFTLDPLRMADAMEVVAEALSEQDESVAWQERAADIRSDLEALHRELEEELSVVPPERRRLVTNHHALAYFADRYDFEVIGTVIPGGGTHAEPSASGLAALAELLRREGITAVFAETTVSTDLAETLASEVGEDVEVHRLYTGSLGPDGSEADTYAGMMRANAATIASVLGS